MKVTVYDTATGASKEYVTDNRLKEILRSSQSILGGDTSMFSIPDNGYWVEYTTTVNTNGSTKTYVTYFLDGMVPEFVESDLG